MKFLLIITVALLAIQCSASQPKSTPTSAPLPAIDIRDWRNVPCVVGRPATAEDIREGRAVLFIRPVSGKVTVIDIGVPRCAILHDEKKKRDVPVIVIQAEDLSGVQMIGFRLLKGGSGTCLLKNLTLLDGPDARFEEAGLRPQGTPEKVSSSSTELDARRP